MAQSAAPTCEHLSQIRACYENSMSFVAKALGEDENSNIPSAIVYYVKALKFLEDGLRVDISGQSSGAEWVRAHEQQRKMMEALGQVKHRLYHLQQDNEVSPQPPPTPAPTYSDKVPEGHRTLLKSKGQAVDLSKATELLVIPNGVQMFFVSSDDHVGTIPPTYPTVLKVYMVDETSQAFLQVGDWIYPLKQNETPILKMSDGAFVFPNVTQEDQSQGSAFGIMLSNEIDSMYVETFENILQNLALFRRQGKDDDVTQLPDDDVKPASMSEQIVSGIEKGTEWIGTGLSKGTQFATGLVQSGSEKIKESLTPNEEESKVNPNLQKGLYYTHEASKGAVKVSKFLVNGLCTITGKVSAELAPHIKEVGNKILPSSATEKSEDGTSKMEGAVKVAGAGLVSFSTIWTQLEKSGIAIARAVSGATVENVEFKYGSEAGKATSHAMGSVVNVGKTAFNLDNLGMKAVAKQAAKDTGKAVLKEYSKDAKSDKLKAEESYQK